MYKRTAFFTAVGLLFAFAASAQDADPYRLSTHILDISKGMPAANVQVDLEKYNSETNVWSLQATERTGQNGRIGNFVPSGEGTEGIYRLRFKTAPYFKAQNQKSVYPYIEVVFEMEKTGHYHIPVTVSANGYATYRGNGCCAQNSFNRNAT